MTELFAASDVVKLRKVIKNNDENFSKQIDALFKREDLLDHQTAKFLHSLFEKYTDMSEFKIDLEKIDFNSIENLNLNCILISLAIAEKKLTQDYLKFLDVLQERIVILKEEQMIVLAQEHIEEMKNLQDDIS